MFFSFIFIQTARIRYLFGQVNFNEKGGGRGNEEYRERLKIKNSLDIFFSCLGKRRRLPDHICRWLLSYFWVRVQIYTSNFAHRWPEIRILGVTSPLFYQPVCLVFLIKATFKRERKEFAFIFSHSKKISLKYWGINKSFCQKWINGTVRNHRASRFSQKKESLRIFQTQWNSHHK